MSNFAPPNSSEWTTDICGCFSDLESCLLGTFCPCILVGRNAEILDQGATSCFEGGTVYCCIQALTSGGCGFLYTFGYRVRLRQKFGLPASHCGDCLIDFCNPHCSVCQVYRELKNRGIDPELGYDNVRHIYDQQPPQVPLQQKMSALGEPYKL